MAFFEFNIAMSGLFAAQRGLQVTSNNISNANTKGYSRQLLSQEASTPLSGLSVGMTGTGVTTTGVNRVRDSFIDNKIWTQNPRLGEFNIKVTQNSVIEAAFGEPSDSGFTGVFNNMFSAMSSLSNNPSSNDAKVVLKEEMVSFTKYFNNIAATLEKQQKDLNFELKGVVNEINSLATRIKSLNQQIFDAELYGSEASTFRDERDNCIDRLSEIVNTEVSEEEYQVNGNTVTKFSVKIAGQTLVDHLNVNTLGLEVRENKVNATDIEGLYDITWSNGLTFEMADVNMSGELKGLLDMRDGAGTGAANTYNGIPYYLNRLNGYVQQFAKTMNEQYSKNEKGYIQINDYTVNNEKVNYVKIDDVGNVSFYKEVAGNVEPEKVSTVKKNDKGEYTLVDKDGKNLGLSAEEVAALRDGYTTEFALFTYTTGNTNGEAVSSAKLDYSQMTATNFSISQEIYDKPYEMRTLYNKDNPSDTSFMLDLLAQKNNKQMFKEGDPKDYMVAIFAELGINAKEAEMYQDTQVAVTNNLKNQRLSVSQVDTTEEFTFLIQYQQAYQAAAKVMNTIDGIYETTIFKLGNF